MSAFVVDRGHIRYLIEAARSLERGTFYWYGNNLTNDKLDEVGQMLWDENIRSVQFRYSDTDRFNLPGPIGETFEYTHLPLVHYRRIDPVQALASCDSFEYQACEHPEWRDSDAWKFLNALRKAAIRKLPGYEDAAFGAPKEYHVPWGEVTA